MQSKNNTRSRFKNGLYHLLFKNSWIALVMLISEHLQDHLSHLFQSILQHVSTTSACKVHDAHHVHCSGCAMSLCESLGHGCVS